MPHYAIGSFTYPLAAGSEAGNLSMPYYATPHYAILLCHCHTIATLAPTTYHDAGHTSGQLGISRWPITQSMWPTWCIVCNLNVFTIWPCTPDSPLYKEAHHMNWFNTSMSSIVRSPLDDLCMDIWISAMIIIRTQITSERQVY